MALGYRRKMAAAVVAGLAGVAQAGPPGAAGDIYIGEEGGGIWQYDLMTGELVTRFTQRGTRSVLQHTWGPDGNLYAITQASPTAWALDKYDGQTGEFLGALINAQGQGAGIVAKGLAFAPDGDIIIGDWFFGKMHRFDGTTFQLEDTYTGVSGDNLGTPNYMRTGPDGNVYVVAGGFNKVLKFDISGSSEINLVGDFADIAGGSQPQDLVFTDRGTMYVSGGLSNQISEFDATTGDFIRNLVAPVPDTDVLGLTIDSLDRLLVTTGGGGGIVWSTIMFDATSGDYLGDMFLYPNGGPGADGSPIFINTKPIPAPGALMLAPASLLLLRRRR